MKSFDNFKNKHYAGSEMQTDIHDCANTIERIRVSIYRNKGKLPNDQFDAACEHLDQLISVFSRLANNIRNGNVPCDCSASR